MSQPTEHLLALADFNDARLDEDEQTADSARHGLSGEWTTEDGYPVSVADAPDGADVLTRAVAFNEGSPSEEQSEHIARHDPARILREVKAKRLLNANWRTLILRIGAETDPKRREALALTRHGLDQFAYQMAAVHAGHPDYQESWRP